MSRSGYTDDYDDNWAMIRACGALNSAKKGKRGQALFKELLTVLDAMPVKRLIDSELECHGEFCTLGALGHARGVSMVGIDPYDADIVAGVLGITESIARDVAYQNDEHPWPETPEQRWLRMRRWVEGQIKPAGAPQ